MILSILDNATINGVQREERRAHHEDIRESRIMARALTIINQIGALAEQGWR
ncbi:hypothetical protein [Phenylobacterium sp.]|uniref:hypothetical protein n=1 Tax=Phenylobacterium sp. TaxID=1871053 RepID=UPI002F3EAA6B